MLLIGRDGQIGTADPSHPKRVLYQAEPRPDWAVSPVPADRKGFEVNDSVPPRGANFSLVMRLPHRYSVRHEDSCTALDAVPGSQSLPGPGHEAHHPAKIRSHG